VSLKARRNEEQGRFRKALLRSIPWSIKKFNMNEKHLHHSAHGVFSNYPIIMCIPTGSVFSNNTMVQMLQSAPGCIFLIYAMVYFGAGRFQP